MLYCPVIVKCVHILIGSYWIVSFCRINDSSNLRELFMKARFARCRSRFVIPVILYENKVFFLNIYNLEHWLISSHFFFMFCLKVSWNCDWTRKTVENHCIVNKNVNKFESHSNVMHE